MKLIMKKMFLFIFVLFMFFNINSVSAKETTINFHGLDSGLDFGEGSDYSYSDLFGNFKQVMPGDKLTEKIIFNNSANDCEYIRLFLSIELKDEETEGIDELDKDTSSMRDFLAQLTIRVFNKDELIYESKLDNFVENYQNIFLGKINSGESAELNVEIEVPIDMGNEYTNKIGEVDWLFQLEAFDSPSSPAADSTNLTTKVIWLDNGVDRPDAVAVNLLRNGVVYDTVKLDMSNQWMHIWNNLDKKYKWTVEEVAPEGYIVEYDKENDIIFITNVIENLILDGTNEGNPMELTVNVKWFEETDSIAIRPDRIKATLYDGKTPIETVWLGEWNNWTYTWTDLYDNGNYSIIEEEIPDGYLPSYSVKDNVVTITNTATLVKAGQNYYPAIILLVIGILVITIGILVKRKKNEE